MRILALACLLAPGVGDPAGMRLEDCSTQRNLTDEGRRLFGRPGKRESQIASLAKNFLEPRRGDNLVLVSHGSTIHALAGRLEVE